MGDARAQLDGVTSLEIDGETREIRYDLGAIEALCTAFDTGSLDDVIAKLQAINGATLPVFLWAGCLHSNPNLTIDEVRRWSSPHLPAVRAIMEAMNFAVFGSEGGGSADQEAPEAGEDAAPFSASAGASDEPGSRPADTSGSPGTSSGDSRLPS